MLQKYILLNCARKCLGKRSKKKTTSPGFLPGSGAQHRPSKKKNIEGSFVSKKKIKQRYGKSLQNYLVRFGETATRGRVNCSSEDSDVPIDSAPPCGHDLPKEKFLEVIELSGLGIR